MRRLLPLLLLGLGGCGWSTGLVAPEPGASVGVEIFRNESYFFDLERDLHRALATSLATLVQAHLEDPARADLVVRGRIDAYNRRGGIRSRSNRWLETGLTVRVQAELWDRAQNRIVAGPIPASAAVGYTRDVQGAEDEARERALANLAQELVLELFTATNEPSPTD